MLMTLSIQKCGPKSIEKNAASNSFVMCTKQRKKNDKTTFIHIGNKTNCNYKCPDLYVNEEKIKESNQSKYLGNIIA